MRSNSGRSPHTVCAGLANRLFSSLVPGADSAKFGSFQERIALLPDLLVKGLFVLSGSSCIHRELDSVKPRMQRAHTAHAIGTDDLFSQGV